MSIQIGLAEMVLQSCGRPKIVLSKFFIESVIKRASGATISAMNTPPFTLYTPSFDPTPFGYPQLQGLESGTLECGIFRLLTGISEKIDLTGTYFNADNRDWFDRLRGAHWTLDPESPFSEVGVYPGQLKTGAFLLQASGKLNYIDERSAGNSFYSGLRFDNDVSFSQRIMEENLNFLISGGFDCFLRKRRAALSDQQCNDTVVGVFPWAFKKLQLNAVLGFGNPPSNPIVILPDGTIAKCNQFLQQSFTN